MEAALEDTPDAVAGLGFEFAEAIEVPGVEGDGFFADDIGAAAEPEAAVGVVEVVGRADDEVVDAAPVAPEFVEVPVEALDLGEEGRVREVGIKDADGIVGVVRGDERPADVADGGEVSGGDVAGGAEEGYRFGMVNFQ